MKKPTKTKELRAAEEYLGETGRKNLCDTLPFKKDNIPQVTKEAK